MNDLLNELQEGDSQKGTKEEEKNLKAIVESFGRLNKKIPDLIDYLGEDIIYPQKVRSPFFRSKSMPNINELREDVNNFIQSKALSDPRIKIKKLLKKYPYFPDLRVLNGIQIYNDTVQSGLNDKKLGVLEKSMREVAVAIHNGGLSIFNATWFVKIYLKYLESLRDKIIHERKSVGNHYDWEVRQISAQLDKRLIEITSLMSIKDKLSGLVMLNSKLKGTAYISECVTKEEIRAACSAIRQDENKTVGVGKTANYVMLVVVTLSLMFARIPICHRLVRNILIDMPDITKDTILQKQMVESMIRVTDFQLALSKSEKEVKQRMAEKLYERCLAIINHHIDHNLLTKPHEADPFLKAAWVVKESDGLFDKKKYHKMLERSLELLKIVIDNKGSVKGLFDIARHLQSEIMQICNRVGYVSPKTLHE